MDGLQLLEDLELAWTVCSCSRWIAVPHNSPVPIGAMATGSSGWDHDPLAEAMDRYLRAVELVLSAIQRRQQSQYNLQLAQDAGDGSAELEQRRALVAAWIEYETTCRNELEEARRVINAYRTARHMMPLTFDEIDAQGFLRPCGRGRAGAACPSPVVGLGGAGRHPQKAQMSQSNKN